MMARSLTEQKFCSWCGNEVTYKSDWMSECVSCGDKKFINPSPCAALLIKNEQTVLLVKRNLEPSKGKYDLPGGFMEVEDQTAEDAACREIFEELGLTKDMLGPVRYVGSAASDYLWNDTECKTISMFFAANLLADPSKIMLDPQENSEMLWVMLSTIDETDFATEHEKRMVQELLKETG